MGCGASSPSPDGGPSGGDGLLPPPSHGLSQDRKVVDEAHSSSGKLPSAPEKPLAPAHDAAVPAPGAAAIPSASPAPPPPAPAPHPPAHAAKATTFSDVDMHQSSDGRVYLRTTSRGKGEPAGEPPTARTLLARFAPALDAAFLRLPSMGQVMM